MTSLSPSRLSVLRAAADHRLFEKLDGRFVEERPGRVDRENRRFQTEAVEAERDGQIKIRLAVRTGYDGRAHYDLTPAGRTALTEHGKEG